MSPWQKSSFSGSGGNGECVELAAVPDALLLRESAAPETVLTVPAARFASLVRSLKTGRLDKLR